MGWGLVWTGMVDLADVLLFGLTRHHHRHCRRRRLLPSPEEREEEGEEEKPDRCHLAMGAGLDWTGLDWVGGLVGTARRGNVRPPPGRHASVNSSVKSFSFLSCSRDCLRAGCLQTRMEGQETPRTPPPPRVKRFFFPPHPVRAFLFRPAGSVEWTDGTGRVDVT